MELRELTMDTPDRLPEQSFAVLSGMILRAKAEELLRLAPVLAQAIPELKPMVGFDQRSPHHAYDLYTHTAHVVAGVPEELTLRWAALLHDVGKVPTFTRDETGRGHFYGHGAQSARMADGILLRLRAPEELRRRAVLLIEEHMLRLRPERDALARQVEQLGRETVQQLLWLQQADMAGKGTAETGGETFRRIGRLLEEL